MTKPSAIPNTCCNWQPSAFGRRLAAASLNFAPPTCTKCNEERS
ncbi:Uncharacterised protein [Vibrio cholerae]|nr:Uncharacterised protein [Vibrio cholerae]